MSSPGTRRDPGRRAVALRRRLRVHAAAALALPREPLAGPIFAEDRDEEHFAQVLLAPLRSSHESGHAPRVGKYYSPLEEQIVLAVAAGSALQGKQIAAAVRKPHGSLRAILRNLELRGVLKHDPKEGYRLAEPSLLDPGV